MIKLIVFDWDGTLADSVEKIIACKQFLARKYYLPEPDKDTVKAVLGMQFEKAMSICFPTAPRIMLKRLSSEFHQLMQKEQYQAELFPGVREVLKKLKAEKSAVTLAVATSKNRQELDQSIAFNHLEDMFDLTCCGAEYKDKPDPAMLYHVMQKFDVKPEACVMVGDTTIDIEFAKNAGVKAIAVAFGAHTPERLSAEDPNLLIYRIEELPRVVDQLSE